MWCFARSLAIGLMILAFSHAPIPWAHRHAGLSAEQLKVHACEFHPGVPLADLPQDWHLHCFLQVALAGEGCAAAVLDLRPAQRFERWHAPAPPGSVACIGHRDAWFAHGFARPPASRLTLHTYPSRDLFKKYGAFLI